MYVQVFDITIPFLEPWQNILHEDSSFKFFDAIRLSFEAKN